MINAIYVCRRLFYFSEIFFYLFVWKSRFDVSFQLKHMFFFNLHWLIYIWSGSLEGSFINMKLWECAYMWDSTPHLSHISLLLIVTNILRSANFFFPLSVDVLFMWEEKFRGVKVSTWRALRHFITGLCSHKFSRGHSTSIVTRSGRYLSFLISSTRSINGGG